MSGCESSELIVIEEPEKLFKLPLQKGLYRYQSTDRNKHFIIAYDGFYIIDKFGNVINELRDFHEFLEDKVTEKIEIRREDNYYSLYIHEDLPKLAVSHYGMQGANIINLSKGTTFNYRLKELWCKRILDFHISDVSKTLKMFLMKNRWNNGDVNTILIEDGKISCKFSFSDDDNIQIMFLHDDPNKLTIIDKDTITILSDKNEINSRNEHTNYIEKIEFEKIESYDRYFNNKTEYKNLSIPIGYESCKYISKKFVFVNIDNKLYIGKFNHTKKTVELIKTLDMIASIDRVYLNTYLDSMYDPIVLLSMSLNNGQHVTYRTNIDPVYDDLSEIRDKQINKDPTGISEGWPLIDLSKAHRKNETHKSILDAKDKLKSAPKTHEFEQLLKKQRAKMSSTPFLRSLKGFNPNKSLKPTKQKYKEEQKTRKARCNEDAQYMKNNLFSKSIRDSVPRAKSPAGKYGNFVPSSEDIRKQKELEKEKEKSRKEEFFNSMIDYNRHHDDQSYDSYYKCEKHDAEAYRKEKSQVAAKKAKEEAAATVAKISHHERMKKLKSAKKIQPILRAWLSRRRTRRKRDAVDKEKRRISVENVVEGNNARIFGRRPSKDAEESRELAKSIGKRVQNKNEVSENVLDDALTAFEQDGGRKKKMRNRKNRKTTKN
jgi:hypothetical protein